MYIPSSWLLQVIELLQPKLAYYENVKAAAERSKDLKGVVQDAPVEAGQMWNVTTEQVLRYHILLNKYN